MAVLHERGIQLRLADREALNDPSGGRNRRRLEQRCHSSIGNPRQPFDLFVVNDDDIFTGRLNALQARRVNGLTNETVIRVVLMVKARSLDKPASAAAAVIGDPARQAVGSRVNEPIG